MAQAQADVGKTQVEALNETIRAEAAKVNGWWGNWRVMLAWSLGLETLMCPPFIMFLIWRGSIADLVQARSSIATWWTARFGLLGVHVWTGSNEREAAITGQPIKGALTTVAATIMKKK